ncbi:G-type lectin S-receptor serine/threonine-protein kinase [Salix suchowensis]|nr:G-type lectin S-receptor serine/threonine-protein kinase [Salix suchowensis]
MGSSSLFLFFSSALLPYLCLSGPITIQTIKQPFTASHFQYIDQSGVFLISSNGNFTASISNFEENSPYYFCITHVLSHAIIWIANRNHPISDSDKLYLTSNGLSINTTDNSSNTSVAWSTQGFNSSSQVSAMQLQDSGNLVLLDRNNVSLWGSFDHPTDTIVMGQSLAVGTSVDCYTADNDRSDGDYRLVVTAGDAVLQWNRMSYWKLSAEPKGSQDSLVPVSFLALNDTGLFLLGSDRSTVVIKLTLGPANFRLAKLGFDGKFRVSKFVDKNWVQEFVSPADECKIPLICNKMGLCTSGRCSCPPNFHGDPLSKSGCTPTDASLALPSGCIDRKESNSSVFYVNLGSELDYFANEFMAPAKRDISLLACQDLCTRNCSCLGIFYGNSSASCYLLENPLGSIMGSSSSSRKRLGYMKTIVVSSRANKLNEATGFPIVGLILLPSSGVLLIIIVVLGFICWRRNRLYRTAKSKLGRSDSSSSELEIISVPGLPVRFNYEDLVSATESFSTQIGSGGFGTVYRGTLPDKSVVAVKKITNVGVQGKKEFCTEIAIIGSTRHVNLVKLKGFCAQGRQRFLVYEYMNRGSLDRTLFGNGPVLEWQERFEIALGTARGLAYLHSYCGHKIIHCDVKPENILLNDNLQVKISDFGLSKLLTPEQSSLFTTMRGTRGYLAPEWITGVTISDKADVYSYGMVLLEIVRGRKNSTAQPQSPSLENDSSEGNGSSSSSSGWEPRQAYFPLHALEMHEKKRYSELADSRLERRVTNEEVEKLVKVALCCLHEDPMLRPAMVSVVSMLEGVSPVTEPRQESLNFLRFYGRRFGEASRIEGSNERNEFGFSSSDKLMSCMSAQQLSGPR